jgi:TolB-like protein
VKKTGVELTAISDSMISASQLRGLEVTSWTTIVRLTERKATLPEISKILDVQYALEGSLLRSGNQGYVTAQLIRLSDDSYVWSEEFDFPWKDVHTVRQKISESVARQMKIQLPPEEQQLLARNSTQNVEAFQAYAKGRYSLIRFSISGARYLAEAEKHFKRALRKTHNTPMSWRTSDIFATNASTRPKEIEAAGSARHYPAERAGH